MAWHGLFGQTMGIWRTMAIRIFVDWAIPWYSQETMKINEWIRTNEYNPGPAQKYIQKPELRKKEEFSS